MPRGVIIMFALCLAACAEQRTPEKHVGVYTLYRNSVTDMPRIHVATFDAAEGEKYNHENCDITRSLFAQQPGVLVKYWCEPGRFLLTTRQ